MKKQVHIGKLIKAKMQEDGRSASWLAEKLHCDRSNVYRIYQAQHIDTEQLLTSPRCLPTISSLTTHRC